MFKTFIALLLLTSCVVDDADEDFVMVSSTEADVTINSSPLLTDVLPDTCGDGGSSGRVRLTTQFKGWIGTAAYYSCAPTGNPAEPHWYCGTAGNCTIGSSSSQQHTDCQAACGMPAPNPSLKNDPVRNAWNSLRCIPHIGIDGVLYDRGFGICEFTDK